MVSEIGVSFKTIEWHLTKMKGIEIKREGPANGGHWIILEYNTSAKLLLVWRELYSRGG